MPATRSPMLGALLLLAGSAAGMPQSGTPLATVSGRVSDLALDSSGELLYCTLDRHVGRVALDGQTTLIADSLSGPIPASLRALVETPGGDIAIIDENGDIHSLPGGAPPLQPVYQTYFMIASPSDLLVDANGTYLVASKSPSTGVRALNWVSADGDDWAYYLIAHQPLGLCADPLGPELVLSDAAAGGALRLVDPTDASHPTSPLETSFLPGYSAAALDGKLAAESDGDLLSIANGSLLHYSRATGVTSVLDSGYTELRGLAIAASSGNVPSSTGFSAYLAADGGPTTIYEVPDVGAPAPVIAPSLGKVPDKGQLLLFFGDLRCYEVAADLEGDLLLGGDLFGSNPSVRRIDLDSLVISTVAGPAEGIPSKIEGIALDPRDGTIWAADLNGGVHEIMEGSPVTVTTLFDDPQAHIVRAKDLALDRQGNLYIADATNTFCCGDIELVDAAGNGSTLIATQDTRGLTPDALSGRLLVSEWVGPGFQSSIGRLDPSVPSIAPIPGFVGMNYTNANTWGDGDSVQDVEGNIYTVSEDDFAVYRFETSTGKLSIFGSGYKNRLSGAAIAPSRASSGSATGWSLYVTEFDFLWELPGVPAPAPGIFDREAPPVGRLVGWFSPEHTPLAMVPDPAGGGFLVSTAEGLVLRIDRDSGALVELAGAAQGLVGELSGLAARPTGEVVVATSTGQVFELDPGNGFLASTLYDNAGGALDEVVAIALDGAGRVLISDRRPSPERGALRRLDQGALELLAYTAQGTGLAIDPLTIEIFVAQEGNPGEPGGELLRVDASGPEAVSGHWRGESEYTTYAVGRDDGALCFGDDGSFYVAEGDSGRVWRTDRASNAQSIAAGNYTRPRALALAPGRAGTAGAQGTSLFVLDGHAIWETGVGELPAPTPPTSSPALAPPADLRIHGVGGPGVFSQISIDHPDDANRVYVLVPSVNGKHPGFPLALLGASTDPRVLPANFGPAINWIGNTGLLPASVGLLSPTGQSVPSMGIMIPNSPSLFALDIWIDFCWIGFDTSFMNGISFVGGTTQFFLGS